jgi:23S rRNA pseudouridine2604 synthase
MAEQNTGSISLNKYISGTGRCSRREADQLIAAGRVLLNGNIARPGNRVSPGDEVLLDGAPIQEADKPAPIYLALNKPVGITCTTDRSIPGNIIDHLNFPERIFPIGRLDKASEGLILLTNDGDIVNKILRAGNRHEKEYIVSVRQAITRDFVARMAGGLPILDTVTQPCTVEQLSRFTFRIVLTQGLNRQIRRMCQYLGYEVTSLKRIRIMHLHLGKLKPGQWRRLTAAEAAKLNEVVKDSSKT